VNGLRCVAAIAFLSLPLMGWSEESEPPIILHMQVFEQGLLVTVSSAKDPAGENAPLKELGRCNVSLWVTADGYIRVVQVIKSTGHSRLDDACLRGMMGKPMLPARDDKGPIDAWIVMPIVWQARMSNEPLPADRLDVPIAPLNSHQSLAVKAADYPKGALQRKEHGDVFLHVDVADSGQTLDVTVSHSSGSKELDDAALAAIRAARFSPASGDQKAVHSTTDVVVSWILPGTSTLLPSSEDANPKP
jgi:TonB family protein